MPTASTNQANSAPSPAMQLLLFVKAITADLLAGRLTLWAGSMVYTTLLSLVPLMAVSFSLLKAFGVHNQLQPLLEQLLTPLGEQGLVISANIIDFVDRVQVGVLGAIGVAFLFVTVVLMISKIEDGLNEQWHTTDSRPWHRRVSYYLSALMLAPLLVFSALSFLGRLLQSYLTSGFWFTLLDKISLLLPLTLTVVTFTLVYLLLPYTTVRLSAAFKGALFSTATWKLSGWVFSLMIASATHYDAIYSSFTIMIVLIMWLYLTWLIFILGARVSFYCQQPHAMQYAGNHPPIVDNAALALAIMHHIGNRFRQGKSGPSRGELSLDLQQSDHVINELLYKLRQAQLIQQLGNNRFVPARALDSITLHDIVQAAITLSPVSRVQPSCESLLTLRLQQAEERHQQLQAITLLQWLKQDSPATSTPG